MESELVKPGEAMRMLGVSRGKLRAMVEAGALVRVRFGGPRGRPAGYSWFRRAEVEMVAWGAGGGGHGLTRTGTDGHGKED